MNNNKISNDEFWDAFKNAVKESYESKTTPETKKIQELLEMKPKENPMNIFDFVGRNTLSYMEIDSEEET